MIEASAPLDVDHHLAPPVPAPTDEPLAVWPIAVPASTAAKLFTMSERAWWRAHSAGKVPLPIRIGRSCRWRLDELEAWARAGAMSRDRWQETKRAQ